MGEPTESLSARNSLTRLFVTSNGGEVENGSQGAELLVSLRLAGALHCWNPFKT